MRSIHALFATGAAAVLVLSLASPASAASAPPETQDWGAQLAAPFSLAVDGQQRVLVADGGTGTLGQLQPDGSISPIIEGVPGLAGIATRGAWLAYASSVQEPGGEEAPITESGLNIRTPRGTTVYADLHAYEWAHNPDGVNTYGITDPDSCLAGMPGMTYTGMLDAHAYNVASWRGEWLVADAGANAILKVSDSGEISTLAVLPPVPVTITGQLAGMLDLPDCAIGSVFHVEPVPTGIAVGKNGQLLVTTLPGFPGMVAAQGALWRLDPVTGAATQLASGLAMPTSIAASGSRVYIAELGGAGVSVYQDGAVTPLAALPGALSVATTPNGTVWAASMASEAGPGTIVSISKGKVKVQAHTNR